MKRISIIGTAGRKDDRLKWTEDHWNFMVNRTAQALVKYNPDIVVSGGAALADHVAVFCNSIGWSLELHLPASLTPEGYEPSETGNISNWYHNAFSQKLRINSLKELYNASIQPTTTVKVYNDFWERNTEVAKSDIILAFTFGDNDYEGPPISHQEAGLKDGGTADTWNKARDHASVMIHYDLNRAV